MPLQPREVTLHGATLLNIGNHVISMVRQRLPYGAGNLAQDVQNSAGESSPRTRRAYDMYQFAQSLLPQGANARPRKPKLLAGIAAKYEAGNCDMAAAMAFTIMRGLLTDDWDVMWVCKPGHAYAAFKLHGTDNSAAIIVDAWPSYGMATLADDHFMGSLDTATIETKQGKADGLPRDRIELNARYAQLSQLMDYDLGLRAINLHAFDLFPAAQYTQYANQLCSNTVSVYQTEDGAEVPSPVQRLVLAPPELPAADDQLHAAADSAGWSAPP